MEEQLVNRLEQTVKFFEQLMNNCENTKLGKVIPTLSQINANALDQIPKNIADYDEAVNDSLKKWAQLSEKIGGDVQEISEKVNGTFCKFRDFLMIAAGRASPSETDLQLIVCPLFEKINEITKFRESKRMSPFLNHISCVDEGIQCLFWVTIKDTPAPHVKDMSDASMFYNNRIMTQFKDVNNTHIEWAKAWKTILDNMYDFVRKNHTNGLKWNTNPASANNFSAKSGCLPNTRFSPPPPPPPPIPSDLFQNIPITARNEDKSRRDALFEQINQGSKVTSMLKKVTSDMQTHKNANLRNKKGLMSSAYCKETKKNLKGNSNEISKQHGPRIYLQDGKQWNIDFVRSDPNVQLNVDDKKQTIYIYKCENSVIKINGKANAITIDGCQKTSVVFDGLVSQIEIINCKSIQVSQKTFISFSIIINTFFLVQSLGELPTASIQKTDGCQIYLSKMAKNAQIVSSKSSEMNILVQLNDTDDEYTELAVPEQFVTTIVGKKLKTFPSDIV